MGIAAALALLYFVSYCSASGSCVAKVKVKNGLSLPYTVCTVKSMSPPPPRRPPPPPPQQETPCRVATGLDDKGVPVEFLNKTVQDCTNNWKTCTCFGAEICGLDQGYFCTFNFTEGVGYSKIVTVKMLGAPNCCVDAGGNHNPCGDSLTYFGGNSGGSGTLPGDGFNAGNLHYVYKMGCQGNPPGEPTNNPNYTGS